ncbi:Gfo/Idh/MocA family protein [Paenibacillus cymbidii]|uniref:Gfo/Idh/MocA family protein n=1 Tax=Paenibacillus cymbidii TaxID=1639034 RepID=UPI001081AD77|nr:Gfo/Idh/MocA family oxidoreductase [Paenibacillus cymbidii]
MDEKKIGVVGIGAIAHLFHLPHYAQHPFVELVAVADQDYDRAQQTAQQYACQAYASAEQMYADADLDAVSICTFNESHVRLSLQAIAAGLDVLVEKPMTTTVEDAELLQRAAAASDRIVMVGMSRRYRDDCRVLQSVAASGELGDIYFAKARILRRRGVPLGWFTSMQLSGGGPMMDIGVHALDAVWWMMGMPQPDKAMGKLFRRIAPYATKDTGSYEARSSDNKLQPVYDVEDLGTAYITFDNGAALTLEASWAVNGNQDDAMKIELFGTKGGASLEPLTLFKESNRIPVDSRLSVTKNDHYKDEIAHFVECVLTRKQPLSDASQGCEIVKMLDAIRRSSEANDAVTVV